MQLEEVSQSTLGQGNQMNKVALIMNLINFFSKFMKVNLYNCFCTCIYFFVLFLQSHYIGVNYHNYAEKQQRKYEAQLNELMQDTTTTINLRYLKLYFIGLSGLGKTTFRKRLTGLLKNISSLSPEDRKRCSTYLAECTQVLAVSSSSKLTLKVSTDMEKEAQLMFAYLNGFQQEEKMNSEPNLFCIQYYLYM